jgi:hypothetical protein
LRIRLHVFPPCRIAISVPHISTFSLVGLKFSADLPI